LWTGNCVENGTGKSFLERYRRERLEIMSTVLSLFCGSLLYLAQSSECNCYDETQSSPVQSSRVWCCRVKSKCKFVEMVMSSRPASPANQTALCADLPQTSKFQCSKSRQHHHRPVSLPPTHPPHTLTMASKLAPWAFRSSARVCRVATRQQQRQFRVSQAPRSDSLNVVCP
jgi:hypothetical protein